MNEPNNNWLQIFLSNKFGTEVYKHKSLRNVQTLEHRYELESCAVALSTVVIVSRHQEGTLIDYHHLRQQIIKLIIQSRGVILAYKDNELYLANFHTGIELIGVTSISALRRGSEMCADPDSQNTLWEFVEHLIIICGIAKSSSVIFQIS